MKKGPLRLLFAMLIALILGSTAFAQLDVLWPWKKRGLLRLTWSFFLPITT